MDIRKTVRNREENSFRSRGKFETLGSNFSQEIRKAKLLASNATVNTLNSVKKRGKYFSEVAKITSAMMADVIGKIRDLGSNFRHETAGLLPTLQLQGSISRTR